MKNNLYNEFLKYENEKKLFDIEYKTFKIWEILRTYIYIDIEQYYNKLQPLFPNKTKNKTKKISLNIIKNSLKILFVKNKDLLFLNNPRRVKQNDKKYYCIYTDLLIDTIKDDFSTITLEDPYWALSPTMSASHFEPIKTESICYLDLFEYIFRIKKYIFKKFNNKEYSKLHQTIKIIESEIEKYFQCDLSNIFRVGEDKVLYLILMKKNYQKLIKKLKPKAILEFFDVFPSKIVVNKIAKEMGIPIIELQHGIVTAQNPIFLKYYDLTRKYDCLPDYVFSYGERLLDTTNIPIKKSNIFYTGSLFLEYKKNEYSKKLKLEKKYILFISQSNLGQYISLFASQLADLLRDNEEYHILYKMHPYETDTIYKCLEKKNITIIDNKNKDLYYYQSISVAQVGIYSTGLYEGLVFELPTFIINHDYGTKEIKEILKMDDMIYYIDKPIEIINILDKNPIKTKSIKYWQKCNKRNIKSNIIKIINKKL